MATVRCPDCQKALDEGTATCPECGRNIQGGKPRLSLGRPQLLSRFGRLGYPLLVAMVIWMLVVILS